MAINWNCDGAGPHSSGTVKRMAWGKEPFSGGSILCRDCWARELAFRRDKNKRIAGAVNRFDLPSWRDAKEYNVG